MKMDIREKMVELLNNDDDLFVECVNELDSWNGYADGFRCWDMNELDDFYCDIPASKLIADLTEDFNINDTYFYFTIWGLESTNDIVTLYRDNADADDVLDGIIENNITIWGYPEFDELLDELED